MAGDLVQVLEGVKPGERVVIEGSFLLRAEAALGPGGGRSEDGVDRTFVDVRSSHRILTDQVGHV
jgi:methyl coenzyme M reductase subunit D